MNFQNKYLWLIVAIGILIAILTIILQHEKLKFASSQIDALRVSNGQLEQQLQTANDENKHLRDMMEMAYDALERIKKQMEQAKHDSDERNAKIDNADSDWLVCPLPNDVRDAFADYCDSDREN